MVVEHDGRRRRTDLDDRSAFAHRLDHFLIELERSDELQRRHHFQFFFGIFQKGLQKAYAGRVDGDIDAAHLALGRLAQRLDIGFLGEIANRIMAADLFRKAFQFVFVAAGDKHIRTFVMHPPGNDLPHIVLARGSENDRSFSF